MQKLLLTKIQPRFSLQKESSTNAKKLKVKVNAVSNLILLRNAWKLKLTRLTSNSKFSKTLFDVNSEIYKEMSKKRLRSPV